MSIALIRRSRKAAKPAGVPMVQSRIAPSGRTTIASSLYSGAIVSTSLTSRSICRTLSRCRLRYCLFRGTWAIISLRYMRTTGSLSIRAWNSASTGCSGTCSPLAATRSR